MLAESEHSVVDLSAARHVISNALAAYCAGVDARDPELIASLLSSARLQFRDQHLAGPEIGRFYAAAFLAGSAASSSHLFTNLHLRVDDATSRDQTVQYAARYQRWEQHGNTPVCAALGFYSGEFAPAGASDPPRDDDDLSGWVWTVHHVETDLSLRRTIT